MPVQPRPAATVVLLRSGDDGLEVLLTRRPAAMAFAADVFVFPGGRVDPGDADPRLAGRLGLDGVAAVEALGGGLEGRAALAFHVAAIREVFEEVGVLLGSVGEGAAGGGSDATGEQLAAARAALLAGSSGIADVAGELDLHLAADHLVPIGHWTTPTVMPRRFDTRFFAAELPRGATIDPAPGEIVEHRWLTPRAALDALNAAELAMWLPTSATLQHLEGLGSLEEIRAALRHGTVTPPRLAEPGEPGAGARGERRIRVGGAGAVPGRTGEVRLVGRREIVVVDPGDPSEAALAAIRTTAEGDGGRIVAIALTSAHPDRAAGAEALAIELEVPIVVGPGGGRDLPYAVVELAAGAVVPFGDAAEPLVLSGGVPGPGSG